MMIKARRQCMALIVFLTPPGDSVNVVCSPCFVPNLLGDIVTAHIRHPDMDHANLSLHTFAA
jgi:hypothetical protein